MGFKSSNIDIRGFVINPKAPVIDITELGSKGINLSNVDNLGYVIDPSEPVFNTGEMSLLNADVGDIEISGDGLGNLVELLLKPFMPILAPAMVMAILARIFDAIYFFLKALFTPSIFIVLISTVMLPNISYAIKKGKNLGTIHFVLWVFNCISGFIVCYVLMNRNMVKFIENVGKEMGHASSIGESIKDIIILTILYMLRFLIPLLIIPILQKIVWFFSKNKFIFEKIQAKL